MGTIARRTWLTMAAVIGLGALAIPGAQARTDPPACHVRNVTRGTDGRSFALMVAHAADGDRLRVRGNCRASNVVIDADIVVRGVGTRRAVLHARGTDRVLFVGAGAKVDLVHLVVTGGAGRHRGGGIHNRGRLVLVDSVVRGNRAGVGGGIWTLGALRVVESVVRENEAGSGGGIAVWSEWDGCDVKCQDSHNRFGALWLTDSEVHDNTARRHGGGVASYVGRIEVTRSDVADNTAGGRGGGIHHLGDELAGGSMKLVRSSVTGNTAAIDGGGVWSQFALVALRKGTTVTANVAGTAGGGIWAVGYLLQDEDVDVSGNSPDDIVADPW